MVGFDARVGENQHRRIAERVLVRNFARRVEFDVPCFRGLRNGPGGNLPEIFFDQRFGLSRVEIAGDDQRGVARKVIPFVELLDVFDGRASQIGNFADHRPTVRMSFGEQVFEHQVESQSVRSVFALSFFVRYDVDFAFQSAFGHRVDEIAHPVGLHPQHFFQRIARDGFVVDGAVVARAAVERSAHRVDFLEKGVARQVFGALEQHVFEEVRETGFARLFAVAAYVILDGHRHYRVGVIVVKNDLEAVREDVFLVIERYAVVVVFISATIHTQKGTCQQRKHQFVSHGSDLCLTSFGFTFKGTYKFSILWFRMKKKSEKPGRRPDFLFSSAAGFCIFASKERL